MKSTGTAGLWLAGCLALVGCGDDDAHPPALAAVQGAEPAAGTTPAGKAAQTSVPPAAGPGHPSQDSPESGEAQEGTARYPIVVTDGARHQRQREDDGLATEAMAQGNVPVWPELIGTAPYRVCIVSHTTGDMRHFADASGPNHASYAKRHGYLYAHYRGVLDTQRFGDLEASVDTARRYGLEWQRMAAIEDAMAHCFTDGTFLCERIMWVGTDVIFTRPALTLDTLLAAEGVNLSILDSGRIAAVLSRQQFDDSSLFDIGAFVVHNGPAGERFVQEVIGRFASYKLAEDPLRMAIEGYAFDIDDAHQQAQRPRTWTEADRRLRHDIVALRQRAMNSFHSYPQVVDVADVSSPFAWYYGDFIAHFAGPKHPIFNANRVARLTHLAQFKRWP